MSSDPTVRASDHERQQVVDRLGEHFATGRLGLSEFEVRVATAYAATTLGDLDTLFSDLPGTQEASDRPTASGSRQRETMAVVHAAAQRHDGPWASWLLTGAICLLIWVAMSIMQGQLLSFWPGWVIGPWGAVLLSRGLAGHRRGCG